MQVINPKRDLPIGLLGSLGVVTTLYMLMSATIVLMVPYTLINPQASFAAAFEVRFGPEPLPPSENDDACTQYHASQNLT